MKLYTKKLPLRDYQSFVRQQMDAAEENSIICQPTGTGKSFIIVDYVMEQIDLGKTVAIIVPKIELIENLERTFRDLNPMLVKHLYTPITSKMKYRPNKRLYIATYGSFMKRYKEMIRKPDIFLHDEAHHCKSKTWEDIVKLPGLHFGMTATPIRLDGKSLSNLFPGFIDTGKTVRDFIRDGYLSDYELKTTFTVDFEKPTGFDNLGLQSSIFDKKELIGDAVEEWKRFAHGEKTVVFTTGKEHSSHVLEAYTQAGIAACVIDSDMKFEARKEALDGFRTGKYLVLINVAIVTEGVDIPDAKVCQLLRFTQSTSLYLQMVGRVLRKKKPGEKALILDHAGNVEYHLGPDALVDWRAIYYGQIELEDLKSEGPKPVNCQVCNHVLFAKISDQPVGQTSQVCPNCGHINILKERKQREMIRTAGDEQLKDFSLDSDQQSVYKIIASPLAKQIKRDRILKLKLLGVKPKAIHQGLVGLYGALGNEELSEQLWQEIQDFELPKEKPRKVFLGDIK